jgi:hypothetical protein
MILKPLVKMASKARVKATMVDYKKKALMKNKAGNPMPKQAHMELAFNAELDVTLGDTLYYINTGTAKSHGDLKTTDKVKMTKNRKTFISKKMAFTQLLKKLLN